MGWVEGTRERQGVVDAAGEGRRKSVGPPPPLTALLERTPSSGLGEAKNRKAVSGCWEARAEGIRPEQLPLRTLWVPHGDPH